MFEALNERYGVLSKLRAPDLRFGLPLQADLTVDCGLKGASEACCRYAHHRTCPSVIVASVVGVHCWLRQADEKAVVEYQLLPYIAKGDLLAEFGQLMAIINLQHATVKSTAEALTDTYAAPIVVEHIEVGVWCLTRPEQEDLNARWGELERQEEDVSVLPLAYLDPDDEDEDERLFNVTTSPDFVQVELYAQSTAVLPGEIGHDQAHRYLTKGVITAPDPVDRMTIKEAAVHVVLADGTETDLLVTARYTGPEQEPLDMKFDALTPLSEEGS